MHTILFIFLLILPTIVNAQCIGRDGFTGQPAQVYETPGPTMGNAYAISNWAPNGQPVITYGPRFFLLSPLLREFVKFHECAHLSVPTPDEIQANCISLTEMRRRGLSLQQEMQIGHWIATEGSIGLQYGGTGATFWQLTLQCAGPR